MELEFTDDAVDKKVKRINTGRGAVTTCEPEEVWRYFQECLDLEEEGAVCVDTGEVSVMP